MKKEFEKYEEDWDATIERIFRRSVDDYLRRFVNEIKAGESYPTYKDYVEDKGYIKVEINCVASNRGRQKKAIRFLEYKDVLLDTYGSNMRSSDELYLFLDLSLLDSEHMNKVLDYRMKYNPKKYAGDMILSHYAELKSISFGTVKRFISNQDDFLVRYFNGEDAQVEDAPRSIYGYRVVAAGIRVVLKDMEHDKDASYLTTLEAYYNSDHDKVLNAFEHRKGKFEDVSNNLGVSGYSSEGDFCKSLTESIETLQERLRLLTVVSDMVGFTDLNSNNVCIALLKKIKAEAPIYMGYSGAIGEVAKDYLENGDCSED
jgi:hypothetical protein